MKSLFNAVFGKLTLGIVLILVVTTAHAQSTANGAGQNEAAVVKYLGMQDDLIVFDVFYVNPEGEKFQVTIKDQD
ncbi:MAG TPA: hypothetical protein VI233_03100, partial [Puia sp.]